MNVGDAWSPPVRARWISVPLAGPVQASLDGRLCQLIRDAESEPLAFFTPEWREGESSGDWYGEHAGKWLLAACAAFERTGDAGLGTSLRSAVGLLLGTQEPSGYLGTYAQDAPARFTDPRAAGVRTWDVWVHAWTILGLVRAADVLEDEDALAGARRIGDLILRSFPEEGEGPGRSVLDLGNHAGLSSTVLIEPLARLTLATGEPSYAAFARRIVTSMEARRLPILSSAGSDPATLGTGKAYQILWTLLGLTALFRATGEARFLVAAEKWADSIAEHHVNPLGGPWGGFGGHKEVFAPAGAFDVSGLVETCSSATWMALCRELALLTGAERHTARYERTLLNALLGAADANGRDWSYFTFANGRRSSTYHWACCKSSGAMALELSPGAMMSARGESIRIDLPLSGEAVFRLGEREVTVRQRWDEGRGEVGVETSEPLTFTLEIRIPKWARDPHSEPPMDASANALRLRREWRGGDRIVIDWETPLLVHPFTRSVDHHGQEIVRDDYAYLSVGPWVYATGLYDGYKKQETLRLPRLDPTSSFRLVADSSGEFGPKVELRRPGSDALSFLPYSECGGRSEGAWRSTWMQVAWQ